MFISNPVIVTCVIVVAFQIDRLRIGHDSKGDGKGIFVEEVDVAPAEGDRAMFPCYCWLSEGKGDRKIERDILPGQPRPPRPSKYYYATIMVFIFMQYFVQTESKAELHPTDS